MELNFSRIFLKYREDVIHTQSWDKYYVPYVTIMDKTLTPIANLYFAMNSRDYNNLSRNMVKNAYYIPLYIRNSQEQINKATPTYYPIFFLSMFKDALSYLNEIIKFSDDISCTENKKILFDKKIKPITTYYNRKKGEKKIDVDCNIKVLVEPLIANLEHNYNNKIPEITFIEEIKRTKDLAFFDELKGYLIQHIAIQTPSALLVSSKKSCRMSTISFNTSITANGKICVPCELFNTAQSQKFSKIRKEIIGGVGYYVWSPMADGLDIFELINNVKFYHCDRCSTYQQKISNSIKSNFNSVKNQNSSLYKDIAYIDYKPLTIKPII